ncbi:MAG: glycosyltransferase family 2 protein, partial [Cyanobacteria bacterium J06607_13]
MTSHPSHLPQVSVLIGAYNEESRIRLTIDSILAQTFSNWELIVVDDCSTDATFDILTIYAQQDPRIGIYRNEQNRGVSSSMNFALQHVRAPLIARIDGDDEMLPNRLAMQVEFMSAHPEIGVLGTSALYVNEQGKILRTVHFPETDAAIRAVLPYTNPIINPSVMIRTQLLKDHPYANRLQRV